MHSITEQSPFEMLARQRSHVLIVLSNAVEGAELQFLAWRAKSHRDQVAALPGVLKVVDYEPHEVDITQGRYPPLPFRYLSIVELSVDGAEAASTIIAEISALHDAEASARECATWLYFPACEKIGCDLNDVQSAIVMAFANPVVGKEQEFREWYATRHLRHAMNVPALTSGQCFERTLFQAPGAAAAGFQTIAIYGQSGPPEAIVEAFATIPWEKFDFPALDVSRFAEWVYRPV